VYAEFYGLKELPFALTPDPRFIYFTPSHTEVMANLHYGIEAGKGLVEGLELFSHLANIGDTRSLVIHPASTTHKQLTDEQKVAAGAGPDVVRLSVGIEDVKDIIADLEQALAKV